MMHDVSFANRIIFLLKEKIGKSKDYKGIIVNIALGPFTHVTAESLRSAFDLLNEKEGFKDVSLNIQKHKAQIKCRRCKAVTQIPAPIINCPSCGADDFEPIMSEEFLIESLEIERD